jgi:hypothetical protein
MTGRDWVERAARPTVLRLAQPRPSDHIIPMPAKAETQFSLFDRTSSAEGGAAARQKRRVHLPDLVQSVSHLRDEELLDLIRVAIGEARRRGIGSATSASDSNQGTAPAVEQTPPARISRKAAATPDIPPAKASMVRAAIRARFSPARVAKDFGVSVAMVRKLAAT